MRVSEGDLKGRMVELSHPEMFTEHEEVIVFTRGEFSRTYRSIMEQIDYIVKVDLHLDRSEDWKLMGYWPKIMQKVHRIDVNMDSIFKKGPIQGYLDAYLYEDIQTSQEEAPVSAKELSPIIKASNLNPLYERF